MSARRPTTIAVLFGGRSVEHDVSIVTGHQIMDAFPKDRYEVIPVYITRDGKWFTGDPITSVRQLQRRQYYSIKMDVVSCLLSPDIRHHGLILNPLGRSFQQK